MPGFQDLSSYIKAGPIAVSFEMFYRSEAIIRVYIAVSIRESLVIIALMASSQ